MKKYSIFDIIIKRILLFIFYLLVEYAGELQENPNLFDELDRAMYKDVSDAQKIIDRVTPKLEELREEGFQIQDNIDNVMKAYGDFLDQNPDLRTEILNIRYKKRS